MTTLPIPAVSSRVLQYLYRYKQPVSIGDLKSIIVGTGCSYDQIIDELFQNGFIAVQEDKRSLSDEGMQYMEKREQEEKGVIQGLAFEGEFDVAVLALLKIRGSLVNLEDFPQLLIDQAPKRPGRVGFGPLIDILHAMEQKGYVKTEFTNWYQLTESGMDYYNYQISKFDQLSRVNRPKQNADEDSSAFTAAEKREMNEKLDQILAMLKEACLGNEIVWTDMKEDFEELRNNPNGLTKKNWRQLLFGKVVEWTAGGVVSETASKQIVEMVKTGVKNLIGGS